MEKYKVTRVIDEYNYELENLNGTKFVSNIAFFKSDMKLMENDEIYSENFIINSRSFYTFGIISENLKDSKDVVVLLRDNKKYYFERYYG